MPRLNKSLDARGASVFPSTKLDPAKRAVIRAASAQTLSACSVGGSVKRIALWIITILLFVAGAYSLLGLLMVASFSVDPGYSPERARFNANLWGSLTVVFFFLRSAVCFYDLAQSQTPTLPTYTAQ